MKEAMGSSKCMGERRTLKSGKTPYLDPKAFKKETTADSEAHCLVFDKGFRPSRQT